MITVGDTIELMCTAYDIDNAGKYRQQNIAMKAKVVFVNRPHGWFTAEVLIPTGERYKESFFFGRRAIKNTDD